MDNLGQRIRARREELRLTQEQIASQVGIKQQSYQAIESGNVKKPRHLYEISLALKCDMAWLLNGKEKEVKNVEVTNFMAYKVPLINYAQAKLWTESNELRNSTEFEYVMTSLELSNKAFALKIKDDSMEPEFKEDDIVIIDPAIKPTPGEFVVAMNGDSEVTFKKYRELRHDHHAKIQFELIPLNPDYTTISTFNQQIKIIGTMIEHRIFRRKR